MTSDKPGSPWLPLARRSRAGCARQESLQDDAILGVCRDDDGLEQALGDMLEECDNIGNDMSDTLAARPMPSLALYSPPFGSEPPEEDAAPPDLPAPPEDDKAASCPCIHLSSYTFSLVPILMTTVKTPSPIMTYLSIS